MNDLPVSTRPSHNVGSKRWLVGLGLAAVGGVLLVAGLVAAPPEAWAAEAPVGLGTAASFSVLGGQAVTNTGPTVLSHDVGVSPGTAITGFPPGVSLGAEHAADAVAGAAQADVTIAYNDAAGRALTASIEGDLGGLTLTTGVYNASSSIGLTGPLTLDAQGDPTAVWIFQVGSTLTTASASSVNLINGADPCNVYWQIGSSATLGTDSSFVGTILALTSITVTTSTTVQGRALARNGQVSLDDNVFLTPECEAVQPTTTTTTTTTTAPGGPPTTTTPADTDTVTRTNGPGDRDTTGRRSGYSNNRYPDTLANTGADPVLAALVAGGTLLVAIGALLIAFTRGRKSTRTPPRST